jgi:hypothetical protein
VQVVRIVCLEIHLEKTEQNHIIRNLIIILLVMILMYTSAKWLITARVL